jgi:hypothetical protein
VTNKSLDIILDGTKKSHLPTDRPTDRLVFLSNGHYDSYNNFYRSPALPCHVERIRSRPGKRLGASWHTHVREWRIGFRYRLSRHRRALLVWLSLKCIKTHFFFKKFSFCIQLKAMRSRREKGARFLLNIFF